MDFKGLRLCLLTGVLCILAACLMFGCSGNFLSYTNDTDLNKTIDSLNSLSYSLRYKSLSSSSNAANKAFELSMSSPSRRAESLNNMGFCSFMRMDFEQASRLFKRVLEISDNEIECLIADVGLMKIYQRTSENKIFYDYRNGAQQRINRIRQDRSVLEDSVLLRRFNYAVSEFHITSGVYYYYLQQDAQCIAEIDAVNVRTLEADTAQWLYYMYMKGSGGMYYAANPEDVVLGEFGYLMECLDAAREWGYTYFEGNALQAMAELLNFRTNRELISRKRKGWLEMVNTDDCPIDSLPLNMAQKALKLFKRYGDWYQISGTYRTMATYYNYMGHPEIALPLLAKALSYVNMHHEKYYSCSDTTDRLLTYIPNSVSSQELIWINDDGIKTVPEWIARLREQLSRTYSAMGMKPQSDYNRNIYLDILDYTRQDKELESRYAALEKESSLLNLLLGLVLSGFIILVILLLFINRTWRHRNTLYLDSLKKILVMCRKIIASVPSDASSRDDVACAIEGVVREDILQLTGASDIWIQWSPSIEHEYEEYIQTSPQWIKNGNTRVFNIVAPGRDLILGRLWLNLPHYSEKTELSLLRLILPYMAWAMENGLNFMSLTDERKRLEKEEYILRQHIAENKRQNVVKKACLAIVTGIVPYIDRVVNEIDKLRHAPFTQTDSIKLGKLNYIDELLTKINDYNEILALWIKMKRGDLSLNVENFSLNDVFSVVAKGRRSFELKKQELVVESPDIIVKADKALTLFMVNTLAENARKYTQEGGLIEISAIEGENYVEISVEDNGPGLSSDDLEQILSGNLKRQKGKGFGLMNCKGIIDKYIKTNPFFSVCMFGVDSTLGKGSRFYFRLPKGVRRNAMLLLFMLVGSFATTFAANDSLAVKQGVSSDRSSESDSILSIADNFANMVYNCNVESDFSKALTLADSVFFYMNKHYLLFSGKNGPLLEIDGTGDAPELQWLASGFDTDYFILLDVRNEVAVAALAVKDFSRYYYNNKAYTSLYKQISEDKSLEEYCVIMQKSSNNKIVALTLIFLIVVVGLVLYYFLYLRRMLHYKYNMEQVFSINNSVFASVAMSGEICAPLIEGIYPKVNELIPIDNMVLGISADLNLTWHNDSHDDDEFVLDQIERCYNKRTVCYDNDSGWLFVPLQLEMAGSDRCVGVWGLKCSMTSVREEDILMIELISGYLAVVLYQTIVQVERQCLDIELAQDEARKAMYEENMLHIQNMVLDNCLSTIKHETIYYPGQLKKLVGELLDSGKTDTKEQLSVMYELVSYYKDVFTILSSCASRQLDEVTFRRTILCAYDIASSAVKYFNKQNKKLGSTDITFVVDNLESLKDLRFLGDDVLVRYMLENLIDEALRFKQAGSLILKVSTAGNDFVRFDFIDKRRTFSQEYLNQIFYPDNARMSVSESGNVLSGTEYLLCKQIIRDHDEYGGKRGCRINASALEGGGFSVWFTLRK